MIEQYIEKEIMRQVKLTEYLYECKKLSITDVAQRLEVSFNTIKRDFQKLILQLEDYITDYEITKTHMIVWFDSNYTRYDLIKDIYSYSKFLNVCLRYLNGESDYLDIVENEFVSVTKAFQLKKSVEKYFMEIGILDENKEWVGNESILRLVSLTVLARQPLDDREIDKTHMQLSQEFVEKLFSDLSNSYPINKREYAFLTLAVYLTISRHKDHPMHVQPQSVKYNLGESLAFKKIQANAELILKDIDLDDNELFFLTSIYKNISLNSDSFMTIQMNYRYERMNVIENNPDIQTLIFQFEEEFQNSLFHQMIFERPLITFCYSTWNNVQNFLLYRHHYLNSKQLQLKKTIKKVFQQWKDQVWPEISFTFNDLAIEWFTSQVASSLVFKEKQKRVFFIVAESEESHILYREILNHWLNLDYNTIDSYLYYSVEELPAYINRNPHIIVCDRSVLTPSAADTPNLFPISRFSIREDLKVILSESLNLVK
ncbi:DeoR family transcriptional regulator [Enterococcus mundtii]|uniref:DeoR family transcriptional regulator n=1 Tax=Enterococcus mundtii TaxID=53346 RepID=UPI001B7D83F0|nr:DeoR family transcriptional regulator [Enterococcus mundtii]